MQLKDWVRSPMWLKMFGVAVALCAVTYLLNVVFSFVDPGNVWGIAYGMGASVLMLGAALYGVRRRLLRYHLGRSFGWVQFHVYGGALFMLLVLMHSGFHLPKGTMNWWLWLLSIWVTISGLVGVFLQKWVPKLLSSGLSVEAVYERVPELVSDLRRQSEALVTACSESLRNFYESSLAMDMGGPQSRLIYYLDVTGGIQSRLRKFDFVRDILCTEERETLDALKTRYRTKLELDAHYTLQKALRWWLFIHVPPSIVLLALVGLHIYSILAY